MRAVTVPVSAASAVAGFVFPGDHVDLVLTQSVPGGGDGPPLKVSETVIRNLRVLATDQRTDNKVGDDGQTRMVRSCVEVPVFDGERVRWADVGTVPDDVVGAPNPTAGRH